VADICQERGCLGITENPDPPWRLAVKEGLKTHCQQALRSLRCHQGHVNPNHLQKGSVLGGEANIKELVSRLFFESRERLF